MASIVLITGLSGAGRSATAAVLEDLGWYVVDNLPTSMLSTIVELAANPASALDRLALVSGRQHTDVLPHVSALRTAGHPVSILFLDATTPELVRRYDATRRRHPLADEAPGLLESIEHERELLQPLRGAADLVIDTTDLNVHQLKERLVSAFSSSDDTASEMGVTIESFGYKHGLPLDADIVMDVRFLPNPHWEPALRPRTGLDHEVRDYVFGEQVTHDFVASFDALLEQLLPSYRAEGRSYLTIAIGCTGGRHRSVAVTEELARRARERGVPVRVIHRDLSAGDPVARD